jgi:hypothetical protein
MTMPSITKVRMVAAEQLGEPVEDRIERHRQHRAPGQDRHERLDDQERPDDQHRQQCKPDHELDDGIGRQKLAKCLHGSIPVSRGTAPSSSVAAQIDREA